MKAWISVAKTAIAVFLSASAVTAQEDVMSIDGAAGLPASHVTLSITLNNDALCQGWSVGVTHDSTRLELVSVVFGPEVLALQSGSGPDFGNLTTYADGFTSGVVIDFVGAGFLPPGDFVLYEATYQLTDVLGEAIVDFSDDLGSPPVTTVVVHAGASIAPTLIAGGVLVFVPEFIRGDCNDDENIDIADVIYNEEFLFLSGAVPVCQSACDTNDDGLLDIADAIYLLNWLFVDGSAPPSPFMACGMDPTSDAISCASLASSCP